MLSALENVQKRYCVYKTLLCNILYVIEYCVITYAIAQQAGKLKIRYCVTGIPRVCWTEAVLGFPPVC